MLAARPLGGARRRDGAPIICHLASRAMLLARIYEVFPLVCPHCGAPMRIIAFVTDTASVTRILQHLGEPTQPPCVAPARGPPKWAAPCDQSPAFDSSAAEPAPGFDFDQTMSG